MFNLIGNQREEYYHLYEAHRMNISATNVYFQNIRLLNTYKVKLLNRDDFKEYYKGILEDIELSSSPIDCLIPNEAELPENEKGEYEVPDDYPLFVVNQLVPEYIKIKDRITNDNMDETLPETHEARMTLKDAPEKIDQFIDEVFVHWLTFKYLEAIEKLHLQAISNFKPVIEYVVNNITEKDLKSFLLSRRINDKKFADKGHEFIFKPDINRMQKFYQEDHNGFPIIDVMDLIKRLVTNIVVKSDIYIITAIYITLSFAMSDIYVNRVDDSECAKYVRDVLSKI